MRHPRRGPGPDPIHRELEFHIDSRADELQREGLSPEAARARAAREFGARGSIEARLRRIARLRSRRMSMRVALDSFLANLRLGIRLLIRSPGFSAVSITTLALGIGAATAIFSVAYSVLVRPLTYHEPEKLVTVWATAPDGTSGVSPSYPDYLDWQESVDALETVSFIRGASVALRTAEGPGRFTAALVSPSFPRLLGADVTLGSTAAFTATDERDNVVILKYGVWRDRFGSDKSIIGETLSLDGHPHTVIAVLAPGVDYPLWSDLWVPLTPGDIATYGLSARDYRVDNRVLGRLSAGASPETAAEQLRGVASRLQDEYPATNRGWSVELRPLPDLVIGDAGAPIILLLSGVALLLLMACANVAGLSLSRTLERTREFSIRASLGARPSSLLLQLLTENLVLSAIGAMLGLLLAERGVAIFLARGVPGLPRVDEIGVDAAAFLFAGALAGAVTVVFGLAPALLASRANLRDTHGGLRSAGALRTSFTILQVSIAVVLLSTAGLLMNSLVRLTSTDPGIDTEDLYSLRVEPPPEYAGRPADRLGLYDRLMARVRDAPAIEAASFASHIPLSGTGVTTDYRTAAGGEGTAWLRSVGPGYIELMDIPVLRGRSFTDRETRTWSGTLLINGTLARQLFGEGDPIGGTITFFNQLPDDPGYGEQLTGEVIGVIGNTLRSLGSNLEFPEILVPAAAQPWGSSYLVVRARPGADVRASVRQAVGEVDGRIPSLEIVPAKRFVYWSSQRERFLATLGSVFAAAALTLAATGIYGLLAFYARARRREIAIRLALGSSRVDIIGRVASRGLALTVVGLAAGLLGSVVTGRSIESMVYGISPTDPITLAVAAAVLITASVTASSIPAVRASRLDPMRILREE